MHSATLAVCVLDMSTIRDTTAGLFVTPETIAAAKAASRKRGVVEGKELARMFAWMRPNDLVWNYVVNNYLLGNDPPAYDILFWNNDTTRLPARLHADFLDLIDVQSVRRAAQTRRPRHARSTSARSASTATSSAGSPITSRRGRASTGRARLYGGARSTFVLSNGGHIQSLINPPGNTRSWFMAGPARAATPDAWLERQARRSKEAGGRTGASGSARAPARCGPAPATLGSARHAPLAAAPGTYVFER